MHTTILETISEAIHMAEHTMGASTLHGLFATHIPSVAVTGTTVGEWGTGHMDKMKRRVP